MFLFVNVQWKMNKVIIVIVIIVNISDSVISINTLGCQGRWTARKHTHTHTNLTTHIVDCINGQQRQQQQQQQHQQQQ